MASAASTAGIIASGVAAPLAALYVGQRSVIYPRPPVYDDAKTYGGEHAEIVRADGVVGLFVPPPKDDEQIVALYFHGNADQITWGGAMIGHALRSRGIGTFAACDVRDLDTDIDRRSRHAVGCDVNRHPDLACLILSNLHHSGSVGPRLDACDAHRGARQTGDLDRKGPLRALVQDAVARLQNAFSDLP